MLDPRPDRYRVFALRQLPARGRNVGNRRSIEGDRSSSSPCDDSAAANLGDFNRSFDE
jgi:hypothetical protein